MAPERGHEGRPTVYRSSYPRESLAAERHPEIRGVPRLVFGIRGQVRVGESVHHVSHFVLHRAPHILWYHHANARPGLPCDGKYPDSWRTRQHDVLAEFGGYQIHASVDVLVTTQLNQHGQYTRIMRRTPES